MTIPERDSHQELTSGGQAVPADAADAVSSTDRRAPSDAAGKPLYAEQDLRQAAGGVRADQGIQETAAAPGGSAPHPAQVAAHQDQAAADGGAGATQTITYSAEVGGIQKASGTGREAAWTEPGAASGEGPGRQEGGVLDSLKETLLSRTEGLRQRGEHLAQTARLKMEVMQYGRDLESLYARLGRAYHHRAAAEVLAVIEEEIAQVERDIALRERQLESQDVSHELRVQRARAEQERPAVNLPEPTMPSAAGAFGIEERPPRTEHHLETEKRDTFFGLDKGGVDQQATVAGGNAAFDTQIAPEDSVVSLEELEKADNR